MNFPSNLFRLTFSAILVLISCSFSHGDDVTWTGAASSSWENAGNWNSETLPAVTDYVFINSGSVNFSSASGDSPNLRGFRQSAGTLNLIGGKLSATNLASAYSTFDGRVNQTGGEASINAIQIGSTLGSSGSYVLSGGELAIARARNGVSLYLGSDQNGSSAGTGNLTVSGGSLTTRSKVQLGRSSVAGTGSFTVLGSRATLISIGGDGNDNDGVWDQNTGSSLVLRFDDGGCTPIVLKDNSGTGTSATFESGTILDVDHFSGDAGGTWTVMEVENGPVNDNGLAFAAGVDTSIWSFEVDNSGTNGRLLVSAVGDPSGASLVIGNTRQQKMRFGMDYERLWFWTNGLNAAERDSIAKWSAIDTRIDFIRVAMNSGYELQEGTYNLSAYTNKIIPMMQEMQEANPDIKFFASPRPLDEATNNVAWQPYPQWITGSSGSSSNFNFDWRKCAEYVERYILLMKSYGFKISFLDLTNEWQSNDGGSRITQADSRDITEYLKANLDSADMPLIIAPSAWNYSQGSSWINNLDTVRRRNAIDIAACHNTDRAGSAEQFASAVRNTLGNDTEIWNTEVHGWKSTSGENETTSFYYYLEKIRAGFSGLNGWLAIGTRNQGHAYILNPSGTPTRNVKYYIFKKLSATSNYGHALNVIEEPAALSHTAALIKGNLMTVWVVNQGTTNVSINITPLGRTISASTVKRTRWTDPSDVAGFVTFDQVYDGEYVNSVIPGESVCCFEVLLDPEEQAYTTVQAEDEDERNGIREEPSGDTGGTPNLGFIDDSTWARYNGLELVEDSAMRFRVARPRGRRDGWIEVYLGAPGASTASILAGTPVGKVEVPETGNWQVYQTIEAATEASAGTYDVVLNFDEVGSDTGDSLFNFNFFNIVSPEAEFLLGDVNRSGAVDFLDIGPFIALLSSGGYQEEADIDFSGAVDFLDIGPFIALLSGS